MQAVILADIFTKFSVIELKAGYFVSANKYTCLLL